MVLVTLYSTWNDELGHVCETHNYKWKDSLVCKGNSDDYEENDA